MQQTGMYLKADNDMEWPTPRPFVNAPASRVRVSVPMFDRPVRTPMPNAPANVPAICPVMLQPFRTMAHHPTLGRVALYGCRGGILRTSPRLVGLQKGMDHARFRCDAYDEQQQAWTGAVEISALQLREQNLSRLLERALEATLRDSALCVDEAA
jgi:hypothetical protein